MIPRTLLEKMRLGVGGAGVALLLNGCAQQGLAVVRPEMPEGGPVPVPVQPLAATLTAEQTATLQRNIPKLIDTDPKVAQEAWNAINALGNVALPSLKAELPKTESAQLKQALARVIRWIEAKGDPCLACGRG